MKFELHHVDILTDDMGKSLAFYQEKLGMQLVFHSDAGGTDVAFLADRANTNFFVELVSPPFIDFHDAFFKKQGTIMDHFSSLVEDVDSWYEDLHSQGVDFVTKPEEFLAVKEMYFYDASGVIAEMMMFLDPSFAITPPAEVAPSNGVDYRLHHISITCREAPTLELMGPPGLWEREQAFLNIYGPGIDHLCFIVDDVDEAYEELVSRGVEFDVEPMDYEGNRLAFFKDPNGVDLELMLPMPRERLGT